VFEVAQALTPRTDVSFRRWKGLRFRRTKGEFVLKLPKNRIDELLTSGVGKRFEPRPGRVMKEWLVPADEGVDWIELAKEACDFVKRGEP